MEIVVNYEEQEYGCCGEPFKIGDEVEWEGNEPKPEWMESLGRKQLFFHVPKETKSFKIKGKITKIEYVYARHEPDDKNVYHAVEYKFGDGQNSDDYECSGCSDLGEFRLTDYLITLEVSSIEEFEYKGFEQKLLIINKQKNCVII